MKFRSFKIPVLTLSVLCAIACTNEDEPNRNSIENPQEKVHTSKIRTLDEAVDIAKESCKNFYNTKSRAHNKSVNLNDIVVVSDSKSRNSDNDTLMYIVNFEDNQGYAIISASKTKEPLLAITDYGNSANIDKNPGISFYLENAKSYLKNKNDSTDTFSWDITLPEEKWIEKIVRDTLDFVDVRAKLETNWGQDNPEGWFCPNKKSGCVPTAIAMITAYFGGVKTMTYTYPDADKKSESINWNDIRSYNGRAHFIGVPDVQESVTYETKQTIARICRQIGHVANSDYSSSVVTNTWSNYIKPTLNYFNPYCSIGDLQYYSMPEMINGIKNGLILMRGTDMATINEDIPSGHAWVADGVLYYKINEKHYITTTVQYTPWKLTEDITYERCYFHLNWGYNGADNGYFSGTVFRTAHADEYDYDTQFHYDKEYGYTQFITIK